MEPKITPLQYTYQKNDPVISVLNFEQIPVPSENILDRQFITFAPGATGGNHQHERIEYFVMIGSGAVLYWLDDEDKQHSQNQYRLLNRIL